MTSTSGAWKICDGERTGTPTTLHGLQVLAVCDITRSWPRVTLGASIVLLLSSTLPARSFNLVTDVAAQAPSAQSSQPREQSPSNMQEMMKMHEQMMAEMKAADSRLDALVKEMNAATGDAKVNAVATVVTELVRQHKSMHERMGHMHEQMMGGRGMMMKK